MVMYGIVAAVLLAATLGLGFVLNRPSGDEKNLQQPYDMSKFDSVDDADDSGSPDDVNPTVKNPVAQQETDYRSKAIELVQKMVRTSRENGNRDKVFCRRLTGDAWLRLGMPDERADRICTNEGRCRSDRTGHRLLSDRTAECRVLETSVSWRRHCCD